MTTTKTGLTIWTNSGFKGAALEQLRQGTEGHRLVLVGEGNADLAAADIAFGQPDPEVVISSSQLQWTQLTSAGYTRYDRDDLRDALRARSATLTNSSHVYDEPCAQHAAAMMLALARQLPRCLEDQRKDQSWHGGEVRSRSFLLNGQAALFLGFGAIGQRLAQLLAPYDMRIIAVRRTRRGDEGVEIVGEEELDRVLPLADHVVNLLPESPSTGDYVNTERLGKMKPGALFYNIGRGATVDQEALVAALESGQVGAAYLDVTSPEPLPPGHALWTAPNCYITPHSAGGHSGEHERLVAHFLTNLRAFEKGEALQDKVV
jgi:phosphoglycerate dehydrogenase-like enzyme